MLSRSEAIVIAKRNSPDSDVIECIHYKNLWVLQIFSNDPDEGAFDPYYSVDQDSGEFKGFPLFLNGNKEVLDIFLKKKEALK